jgi:pimeloyl-ACP methyl ester carboxylesterase
VPRIDIAGIEIEYELLGEEGAPPVAVTPGGRFSKDAAGIHEFGHALAAGGRRVLLWDRPNCGASDISFAGDGESSLQASVLAQLIRALDLGPTAVVGGSAGARVSLFVAKQDPDVVSHLVLWWISGGLLSLMRLGSAYCCELAVEAAMGGMEAVAAMPAFAEQIQRNPRNRAIILQQDPQQFIARMERWARGFVVSDATPVTGFSKEDFARMDMPVMIFRGAAIDLFHPAYICEQVDQLLPHSELADPPWTDDIFAERMRDGTGHFIDWPLLAPAVLEFIGR